jgi:predicted nucleotidyltransferase
MITKEVMDPVVRQFRDEALPVIRKIFHPEKVLVFGSRAKGAGHDESDLDIIVVSDAFQNVPFIKRYGLIFRIVRFPVHVDYICYTPEEFEENQKNSVIIHDAMSGPVVALV